MNDILYWITYPIRRFVLWARHLVGSCHEWCAHCITQRKQIDADRIMWILGDPEPITWQEYCQRMQKTLDKQEEV
jgi:hypothetical protein